MKKQPIAVVAVATNLVGALVEPVGQWPAALCEPNLAGEIFAEVVAVFVADLDDGGEIKLLCRSTMSGALVTVYAQFCKVRRLARGDE